MEVDKDKQEGLLDPNQVDAGDNDDSSSDDSLNGESEDYDDTDIKDDVLRPASTRSKIVVNLSNEGAQYKYNIDPYDAVRMKLFEENQKLFKAYEHTINSIEKNRNYQPKNRSVPLWISIPVFLGEGIVVIFFAYIFFLIIQLALFNLVIIGIIWVIGKKLWQLVEALRWKFFFQYKTKDFIKFIDQQNQTVYNDMHIEI